MSEENTAQNPGLILPDDAAPVSSVSATDRLLAFNEAGDPLTATASQLKEYATEGMATTQAMNTALAGKASIDGDASKIFAAQSVKAEYLNLTAAGTSNYMYVGRGDKVSSAFAANEVVIHNPAGKVMMVGGDDPVFVPASEMSARHRIWHAGNLDPAGKVNKAGDTMTGRLIVRNDNNGYTGAAIEGVDGFGFLRLGNMSGGAGNKGKITGPFSASLDSLDIICENDKLTTNGKRLWHEGNFDPAGVFRAISFSPSEDEVQMGIAQVGNRGVVSMYQHSYNELQFDYPLDPAARGAQLRFRQRNNNTASRFSWYEIYHSGNLAPATASAAGLMSAEDRIKLNSVASALSLPVVTEDTPTTLEETDEDTAPAMAATPQACIRAQRAAQYQMQTDELLYDALEAFARNHPEYSEFTAWLEAKDRIRRELPKPQEGGTNE